MKRILLAIITLIGVSTAACSQAINWRSFNAEQKHIIGLETGWDYGLTFGAGYGYRLKTKLPVLLNAHYSFPSGKTLFDDLKIKGGVQMEVCKVGGFSATLTAHGILRRFENSYARLVNFGSEFSAVAGYYRLKWYAAGAFGFDKAIATHIRHGSEYREHAPGAQSGWYIPTGGNFHYGLQAGISGRKTDVSLALRRMVSQGFETAPFIPYYANLGVNRRF